MAINLNVDKYGAQFNAFRSLANDSSLSQDALVSVDEAGRGKGLLNQDGERRTIVVKKGDTIRPLFGRSQGHKDLNNEVRDLFKETVLRICGKKSLNDLPKAIQDVMKKDDYDNRGHPLSLRRIRDVTNAILAEADREAKAGASQAERLTNTISDVSMNVVPKIDDGQEKDGPGIDEEGEVESSVDDDEVSFAYATPDYAKGLPPETEKRFMEFYCDAVDQSVEEGQTKNDCDETLGEMFKTVGYDKGDRELLAELLANGKPAFLEKGGSMPFRHEGVKFAERFKAILDLTKECRAKLKPDGNIVADTILATLKTVDRIFDVDELPYIDAYLCERISAVAKKVDATELLSPPPSKGHSAKSLNRRLDSFQHKAAEKFRDELLSPNDSDLMITIKQNLLMNMALAHASSHKEELVKAIDDYYDDLAGKYVKRDLLIEIAPGLGLNANAGSIAAS